MLVTKEWLRKWGACWSDSQIAAMGVESMTPAQVVAEPRILDTHKTWVICRVAADASAANAAIAADAADAAIAAIAANAVADAAGYAAIAASAAAIVTNAAIAASAAANAAAYDANANANAYAAHQSYTRNLAFALTLLPDGGNS